MIKRNIKKGTALFMAVLVLGTAACGQGNGTTGDGGVATPTVEAQEGVTNQPTVGALDDVAGENGQQSSEGVQVQTPVQDAVVTLPTDINESVEAIKSSEVTESATRTATVVLGDNGISINGTGCEADGNGLKIKEAGTYEISGTLSDGSIYVNADNESDVHLILNGVTVHNETSAAIFCKKAAKVTITLAEGSVNTLSDGAEYVFKDGEDEPDSTLYAKHDLVINGTGTLKVTSAYGDAVKGKDSFYILGGNFVVNSADDGIVGRDLLYIADGTFAVRSASDAIKANNDEDAALGNIVIDGGVFNLEATEDGIQAENKVIINDGVFTIDTSDDSLHSNKNMEISGGKFQIVSGDDGAHADESLIISGNTKLEITKSKEGLEAQTITVSGGEITVVADDDGLNAAGGADGSGFGRPGERGFAEGSGEIIINGGTLTVSASGDGIDSNGSITMNGGTALVYGPTGGGNGVLDYGGTFLLNGGTLLCVGTSGMAQMPTDTSGQYSLAAVLSFMAAKDSVIEITVDGKSVLSTKSPKGFNYIVASTADFAADADVAVLVNGTECYTGALTEVVTCFGITGGMGGFGGGFGGGNFGGGGRGDKGNRPEMPEWEMPEWEMPKWSDGEMPEMPKWEMPKWPDGEMPKWEMPEWPDGERPEMPNGERPERPKGDVPQTLNL